MPKVSNNNDKPSFANLYSMCGVDLVGTGENRRAADGCPFCERPEFYVNITTGQYCCHHANNCGAKGNARTFVTWFHKQCVDETTDEQLQEIRDRRGLPLQTLKRFGVAYSAQLGCYVIPYFTTKETVANLQRY